jgi:hypothetical protein
MFQPDGPHFRVEFGHWGLRCRGYLSASPSKPYGRDYGEHGLTEERRLKIGDWLQIAQQNTSLLALLTTQFGACHRFSRAD